VSTQKDTSNRSIHERKLFDTSSNSEIRHVFFGIYGPEDYVDEGGLYFRRLNPAPSQKLHLIRVRAYVPQHKESVRNNMISTIDNQSALIWNYEVLEEYQVRDDLGNRYGRLNDGTIDAKRTVLFIRYWDAACRYILDILTDVGNWDRNVDVWGVPHLVNNSLGAWLRLTNAQCSRCRTAMYLSTIPRRISQQDAQRLPQIGNVPIFLFICPECSSIVFGSSNI
jgi:hypothetical protein